MRIFDGVWDILRGMSCGSLGMVIIGFGGLGYRDMFGSYSSSKWAYWGWSVRVFGMKYFSCLCVYARGRFLEICDSGPGLSSMSPCWRISVELFDV